MRRGEESKKCERTELLFEIMTIDKRKKKKGSSMDASWETGKCEGAAVEGAF